MKNTLNGFPIDGTAVSQLKYDMFAQHLTSALVGASRVNSGNPAMMVLIFTVVSIPLMIFFSLLLFLNLIVKNIHELIMKKHWDRRKEQIRLDFLKKEEERKYKEEQNNILKEKKLDEILSGLDAENEIN